MTTFEIILLCSNITFVFILGISIFYNIRHALWIIRITESIEKTLDILDERYSAISKVLEVPLFFDSPQIRGVVEDIKTCRDSLLESATILADVQQDDDEEKTDN